MSAVRVLTGVGLLLLAAVGLLAVLTAAAVTVRLVDGLTQPGFFSGVAVAVAVHLGYRTYHVVALETTLRCPYCGHDHTLER